MNRRDFLIGCGQAAAVLVPAVQQTAAASPVSAAGPPGDAEFHLHPHYREKTPLDPVLYKRNAAFDNFINEKYHDQIAAVLAQWSAGLMESVPNTRPIEETLAAGFQGPSLRPLHARSLRPSGIVEVHELSFTGDPTLPSEAFVRELRLYLNDFREIRTAEFQITNIETDRSGKVLTRVRYELVGSGNNFYREHRVGTWNLEWEAAASHEYHLHRWVQSAETRSHSAAPVYDDWTKHAFARNNSYSAHLSHGVDYWRTVLDGACGIDLYGHNGVSVGDIGGTGLDAVYICQPAGLPNRLYRNRGDGTFEDITESSGLGVLENTACAIFADFDNDGRQDLVVVRSNGPLLFVNQGDGKFRRQPDAFRFASIPQGTFTGATAADYDRDGWLDIYFCLYVYYQGADQYKYPTPYHDANNGPPNFLMRNNRDGTFRDVTSASGLNQNNTRYSFCCGWDDFNNNGWPGLYVANDFGRKNLYRNNGDGTFTDIAAQAGVEDIGAGMSVCSFDYDDDSASDLYVANMWTAAGERITSQESFRKNSSAATRASYRKHAMGNSLFRNKGSSLFEDKTAKAGVGMGRWSWSSDAWDFDHDGFPDLYVTNGMISGPLCEDLNSFFWRQVVANSPDEAKPSHAYEQGWNAVNELIRADYSWSGYERNVFYTNNQDGTFADISGALGLDFTEDARAFALADFDHDGRLEVLLKNRNAPQVRLLKNVVRNLPPSISFRLRGVKSNRDAIGAVLTLQTEIGRQTRTLQAGSGFLSQHTKEIFFGLGQAQGPIHASIRWPSGLVQSFNHLPANHRIHLEEGSSSYRSEAFRAPVATPANVAPQDTEMLPAKVGTWLLDPVTAPDFELPDLDGNTRTLSAFRGKPVLLHFWISESKSFENDVTALNRLHQASPNFQLLAVNFDEPRNEQRVRALIRDHNLTVPVLRVSEDMAAIYNILYRSLFDRHRDLSLPASLLLNRQGEIVKVYQGPVDLNNAVQDCEEIPSSRTERLAKALPFPSNAEAFTFGRNYLSLGSVYFQRGYLDQAGSSFQLAIRDDPSSAEAHYGLGSVFLKQSKAAEARASFEQAVKLTSSYPDTMPNAWNNLGLIAAQQGLTGAAIGFFQEALRINPDHLISLENLGSAYRQEKRWGDARQTLERALNLAPDEPELNYSLGMVFAQTGDTDRAYAYLQKTLELRPTYPEAMNNLGVLYLRTRRHDEAVVEFEKCIQAAPGFDQSYLNLARVYVIDGDRDKARATLLALLKQHPNHLLGLRALEELKQ